MMTRRNFFFAGLALVLMGIGMYFTSIYFVIASALTYVVLLAVTVRDRYGCLGPWHKWPTEWRITEEKVEHRLTYAGRHSYDGETFEPTYTIMYTSILDKRCSCGKLGARCRCAQGGVLPS